MRPSTMPADEPDPCSPVELRPRDPDVASAGKPHIRSVLRVLLMGVAVALAVGLTGCSLGQRVASPDNQVLAIMESSIDPPNQSWSITAMARGSDIPYLVACLSNDAGSSFESMRWVGPRSLQIVTDGGAFEVRVGDNGQRLSLDDAKKLNGLC